MANDSLVSKSTQPVSEINTGTGKNNTIKHELAKQLNDYRNKQRDSYSQMNRQRGQGAAENRQRGQNAAGVNPQRSHNDGANRQHGLNAGMSQNKHKHNNSRVQDRNTQTKRFFLSKDREKPPIKGRESTFSDLQPKPENTYDKPHKTDELLEGVSPWRA